FFQGMLHSIKVFVP
ncbi:hypothetical protein, partial [Treponema pallidum]